MSTQQSLIWMILVSNLLWAPSWVKDAERYYMEVGQPYTLGSMAYKDGKYEEAKKQLDEALALINKSVKLFEDQIKARIETELKNPPKEGSWDVNLLESMKGDLQRYVDCKNRILELISKNEEMLGRNKRKPQQQPKQTTKDVEKHSSKTEGVYITKNGYLCALYRDTLEKALEEYPKYKPNDPLSIELRGGSDAIFRTREGVRCRIIAERKTKKGDIIVQTESEDISPLNGKTVLIWTFKDALE